MRDGENNGPDEKPHLFLHVHIDSFQIPFRDLPLLSFLFNAGYEIEIGRRMWVRKLKSEAYQKYKSENWNHELKLGAYNIRDGPVTVTLGPSRLGRSMSRNQALQPFHDKSSHMFNLFFSWSQVSLSRLLKSLWADWHRVLETLETIPTDRANFVTAEFRTQDNQEGSSWVNSDGWPFNFKQ